MKSFPHPSHCPLQYSTSAPPITCPMRISLRSDQNEKEMLNGNHFGLEKAVMAGFED